MVVEGVLVEYPVEITFDEAKHYALEEIALWREKGKTLDRVELKAVDGDVIVKAIEKSPIRRIRRITGYLSELQNFNDAKQTELVSRVQHDYYDFESVRNW